jgi:putative ABC transport system permease protein
MSAIGHKSWRDLRRRPTRTIFTIATIAFAVAGLWIFAMPILMTDAMNERIAHDRLDQVRIPTTDVVLGQADLAAFRAVPGVTALTTRTLYQTKLVDGSRRRDVLVAGVSDWSDQPVNAIAVQAGRVPDGAQVLTDPMNSRSGRFTGGVGSHVSLEDSHGAPHPVAVVGRGDTLALSQLVAQRFAVLYAPQVTVNELAGAAGVNSIEIRVRDPKHVTDVASAVRSRLVALKPGVTFPELATVRKAGQWPGQDVFNKFATLLYVGAILALVSAIVLISNTMTTTVAEQRREIAVMKAIGGRRRQIRRSFSRTALALGGAGTLLGIALGIPFANLVLGFIGNRFFGITPTWGVPTNALIISVVVGVGATWLAALPSLRRAARSPVREGLQASTDTGKNGRLDHAVRRARVSRPTQIGLRNVARRRTRTYATVLQICLAVSVALGFLALGVTIATQTAKTWDTMTWDVLVSQRGNVALDRTAGDVITSTPGVKAAQPILINTLRVHNGEYEGWGVAPDTTLYQPMIVQGRWLQPADESAQQNVVVIGRALANIIGAHVGDIVTVGTARGDVQMHVVGIDRNLMNNASTVFVPLGRFQTLLGRTDTNGYWLVSNDPHKASIDRLATTAEERLTAAGYPVSTQIRYVERAANLATNRVLVGVLAAIGIPIVIIGMIGLLNTMTMNVIERTREIGIMRCLGAPARAVRRVFRTEALTVAFAGAVLAIPGGWLIGALLCWIVTDLFHYGSVPYSFPPTAAGLAILATLAVAWLVVAPPVRRACRLQPGDALRYE